MVSRQHFSMPAALWMFLGLVATTLSCKGPAGPGGPGGRGGQQAPPPRPTPVQLSASDYREPKFQVQEQAGAVYALSNVVNSDGVNGLRALQMQVYVPQGHDARDKPAAVILDAGGGAAAAIARGLAARGYIAMVAQIRTAADRPPDPANAGIVDARAAVRWAHAKAQQFGVEPTRMALIGVGDAGATAYDAALTDPEEYVGDAPREYDRHRPHPFNNLTSSAFVRAAIADRPGSKTSEAGANDPVMLLVGAEAQGAGGQLSSAGATVETKPGQGGEAVEPMADFLARHLIEQRQFFFEVKLQQDPHGKARRVPGGGYYKDGQRIRLEVEPDPGYRFMEWQGDGKEWNRTADVTVKGYMTVSPRIQPVDAPVMNTIQPKMQGQGTVALDPPGGTYPKDTYIRLYKLPQPGWRHAVIPPSFTRQFDYMDLLIDRDSQINILFEEVRSPQLFKLTATTNGSGTVALDPPGGEYLEGTVVRATAQPGAGQSFAWWAGDTRQTGPTITAVMSANKTVTAGFVAAK